MEEVSILNDAVSQLDDPFLLVIVMNLVDTPGTNVILQRQQRLTEEFVPRADLLLFVMFADRPLTESELEEAIAFIKENIRKLLNAEHVTLYPVSARSAIEAKLSVYSDVGKNLEKSLASDSHWKNSGFFELERFLFSFLDGSTDTGMEKMKLKLGTPLGIADRLFAACETVVRNELESARQDLVSVNEIVSGVEDYAIKLESESIAWRKKALSMIDNAQACVVRLVESTLRLSNLDLVASYVFKGEKAGSLPAISNIQNDIIGSALSDAQKLLGEYLTWLQSNNAHEGKLYKETFEKKWPSLVNQHNQVYLDTNNLLRKREEPSVEALGNFSANAATKLFEQEIREVVLVTFGGLGMAGLSASLLTSVLPTTWEDVLALGLCSAGGLLAISNFPSRRKEMTEKIKRTADALARELEDAMQQDLLQTVKILENFVKLISEPFLDAARQNMDRLLEIEKELVNVEDKLQTLKKNKIQNLHLS